MGAIYCGGSGHYLSPLSFIRNPSIWIRAISRYKATHIQAPNFAYALTARKYLAQSAERAGPGIAKKNDEIVDLSSIRHMINAAEPVEASSIDLFYAVFCPLGLKKGVIYPTYGLAEHTVYVCSNGVKRICVDKVALERDRKVSLLPLKEILSQKDPKGEREGDNVETETDSKDDKKGTVRIKLDLFPAPYLYLTLTLP